MTGLTVTTTQHRQSLVLPPKASRKDADAQLAAAGWCAVRTRSAPLWAAAGIAILFSVRAQFCTEQQLRVPDGVDFKWYGEHCGPGHGTAGAPVDELDAACRAHDRAYKEAR